MLKPLVLASHNWKVLLKSLVYQALLLALVVALGYLIFGNLVDDMVKVVRENNVGQFLTETFNSVVDGKFDKEQFSARLGELISDVRKSLSSVRLPFGGVEMTCVLFCVLFVAYRVLVSLTDVAAGCQLEEFMTSNAERPFTWFVIKKQSATWQFALLQTALALPIDVLIVCGCVFLYLLLLIAFGWWTIFPVAASGLLLYTARQTFFGYTLPAVVCGEGSTRKAFKEGLACAPVRFWHLFWKTLVVILIMATLTVLSVLFIDNPVWTLVANVPSFVLFFYLKCVNMVEYFRLKNRPFFYKRVEIEGTDRYNRRQARRAKRANSAK